MVTKIVEIGDEAGKSFKISVNVQFSMYSMGNWRSIDKGFIRYNSGETVQEHSNGTLQTSHLYLKCGNNTWGIRLNDFQYVLGAHKHGTGWCESSWVVGLRPGRISWSLV